MSSSFVHLHLHTQYSLLDGAIRIADLPAALQARGFGACAVTDHGNLFGAVEFYHAMKKGGIKPIIGMEAYVAEGHRTKRGYQRPGPNAAHLVLLCQNQEGYRNLIRLASLAYMEGKYYGIPRLDTELLEQHNAGLIALSACLGGVVNRPLLQGDAAAARAAACWYRDVFEGRFYLEIQDHGLDKERQVNATLVGMAAELGIPLVGTNDCHYLDPGEAYPHWLLQLVGWQKKVSDPDLEPFLDRSLYLKTGAEMAQALAPYPAEAVTNAAAIAEQCDLSLDSTNFYLPKYDIPADFDEKGWFVKEAEAGLARRFEVLEPLYGVTEAEREAFRSPYHDRLAFELDVINKMDYSGYFLIVAEFINWAKENGVRVGPGRGSGAGSLVAYALRITDLDPLWHGLLFERFLNPERVSLPDFDIDFDVEGREKVIDYVRGKYGADKVCQISTFGTLGAKAAVRAVARVLDFPYSHADKIAKLIPNVLNISLQKAIEMEPELARMEAEGDENERKLIQYGKALEGLNSNLSTHAAGVIIMDTPIMEVMPVCTPTKGEGLQSMYSMKWAEDQGAVKFDFLGLLNLTIIQKAVRLINAGSAAPLDIDALPLDDEATYQLLARGDTMGVFQLESGGMRRLLMDMKPTTFVDIVALLALYRPGPLGSGMADEYVKRKHALREVTFPHPLLEPVLKETYGVMVYQEQVMQAVQVLAGFSLGQSDILRRAIGKKNEAELAQQRALFVAGCAGQAIAAAKANEIFDLIDFFSGYGFNKSHSAAYGMVAYQTAYLKAHHPVAFMTALLSSDMDNTDKVVNFIADCHETGVRVLPPDINHSEVDFTVEGDSVRFGLNAVKNVGRNAVEAIIAAREQQPGRAFADLAAFVGSADLHRVNKRVIEALIKCGGFDSLEPDRARLLAGLDEMVTLGLNYRNHQAPGQENLFDLLSGAEADKVALTVTLPDAPRFSAKQRLHLEKEALGFYLSGHPMDRFRSELTGLVVSTNDVREGEVGEGQDVLLGGVVAGITVRLNKAGEKFAIVRLEDLRGSLEVVVFARTYAMCGPLLHLDEPLLVRGKVQVREEEINVRAADVVSLSRFRAEQAERLTIAVEQVPDEATLRLLVGVFSKGAGACGVWFRVRAANGFQVEIDTGFGITPDDAAIGELEHLLPEAPLVFEYPRDNALATARSPRAAPGAPAPAPPGVSADAPTPFGTGLLPS